MLQTLDNVLTAVNFRDILSHYNPARPVQYNGIRWFGTGCRSLEKQYIYIGKTSQLPDDLPFEDIGLIVVRDDSRKLSDLAVEVVEISPKTNVPELCLRIQEQVFRTYKVSRVSQAIIEKMFCTLSVKEISDIISEHMDNPVFITFRFGNRSFFYSGDATIEAEASILRSIRGGHADFQAEADVERIFRSSPPYCGGWILLQRKSPDSHWIFQWPSMQLSHRNPDGFRGAPQLSGSGLFLPVVHTLPGFPGCHHIHRFVC